MKKLSKISILLTLVLILFVPLNPAKADGVFLDCRNPLKSINFKTSGFIGTYSTALSQSFNLAFTKIVLTTSCLSRESS